MTALPFARFVNPMACLIAIRLVNHDIRRYRVGDIEALGEQIPLSDMEVVDRATVPGNLGNS